MAKQWGWMLAIVLFASVISATVLKLEHEVSSSTTSADLQAAIDQVQQGGRLCLIVTDDTVVSLKTELVVSRSLNIEKPACANSDGSGCPQLVLDGGGATRVFLVLCPDCSEATGGDRTTLTLANMHIRNGTADSASAAGVNGGCVHLGMRHALRVTHNWRLCIWSTLQWHILVGYYGQHHRTL